MKMIKKHSIVFYIAGSCLHSGDEKTDGII